MASFRFTALLFATFCLCQMVAVLGFVAPKTSIAVGSSISSGGISSDAFVGEAWQGAGQRRGRSCAVPSRREMDTTMRLGVSTPNRDTRQSSRAFSCALSLVLCRLLGESKLQIVGWKLGI